MNSVDIIQILKDTAYIRTAGSKEETACAEYLKAYCEKLGLEASLMPFEIETAEIKSASLTVDGKSITCKGYHNCGSGEAEGEFYYLRAFDKYSLSQCKGKIVMFDGYMGCWMYRDLLEAGALGFITYDGNNNYSDNDIDQRQLRPYVSEGKKILGVNINAKDAIAIIDSHAKIAKITVEQNEFKTNSHNVIASLEGEIPEYITLTAHYDTTSLSQGAYDNMSGSIGLLALAEHFKTAKHRYGLRFIWCGSEECGLLGSKAYTSTYEEEMKNTVLNINLDMIGCIMGKFIACCSTEEALTHYIKYFASEYGMGIAVNHDVYSSDSTPFADKGVPALSFARIAPQNTATIHNRYDTISVMSGEQMVEDIEFIKAFTDRMANAARMPVAKEIPDNIKEKLDYYLLRKRKK